MKRMHMNWMELSPTFDDYIMGMIEEFEKEHPHATVRWEDVPAAQIEQKTLTEASGGNMADVVNLTFKTLEEGKLFQADQFKSWYEIWQKRLMRQEQNEEMIKQLMLENNPAIIARNHIVEGVIEVTTTLDSDVVIDGTFIVDEDSMRIEATTNLLPGTRVKVDRYMEPFRNRIVMGMLTNDDTEVLEDGRIIVEMDSPSEYQTGKALKETDKGGNERLFMVFVYILKGEQKVSWVLIYGSSIESVFIVPYS